MERLDILKANEYKFWLRVKKGNHDECWIWTKFKNKDGYGDFQFCYNYKKYRFRAHRTSYELTYGKIPNELLVCHKCDNPQCVNPSHLFIGTHKDNCDDKIKKGRHVIAEKNGRSKLTWDIVNDIRNNFDKKTSVLELSEKYLVDYKSIRNILCGITWNNKNYIPVKFEDAKFIKGHNKTMVLSEEEVIQVKKLINKGLMPKEISEITGVKNQTIRDIKRGVAYFNIKL